MRQVYKIIVELEDLSDTDGEDIELAVEEALAYLPDDLIAHVVECDLLGEEEIEDY